MDHNHRVLIVTREGMNFKHLVENHDVKLYDLCKYDLVITEEQYNALDEKYNYDALLVTFSPIAHLVIRDQTLNSQKLKWVHSFAAGLDFITGVAEFKEADQIILTNAKGAFSESLAEFAVLGILYHKFDFENRTTFDASLSSQLSIGIVGYGDIGYMCAKLIKETLGMKVMAIKRNPEKISQEHRQYCDELYAMDKLDYVLASCDYVLNVLPYTEETKDVYTYEKFQLMKPSSIFMNIGRGKSVLEVDLIKALQEKIIRGAVLDVFYDEPLPEDNKLWELPNILITPHCADITEDIFERSFNIFIKNLIKFNNGEAFENICDKRLGY